MGPRRGRRYKWTILPIVAVPVLFLSAPVIFFQVYFSLHQWTAYLGDWWQADFVGLDNFAEVLHDPEVYWSLLRSLFFARASTILFFLVRFSLAFLLRA